MTEELFPRDPDEAALAWFSRLRGRPTSADRAEFGRWVAESPAHAIAWRRIEASWAASADAGLRVADEEQPKLAAYLDRMDSTRRKRALRQTGTALVAALAVFGGAMWLERPNLFQDLTSDYVTARGERRTITLTDGSTVMLNADTAIDENFSVSERRVRLARGTAFFSVTKTGTPFVVETEGGEVRVLGTQFDVRTNDSGSTVTLAEGSVEADAGSQRAVLKPGEQIRFMPGGLGTVAAADLDATLAWRDGRFVFSEARLADVVAEIGRYRGGRIVIADDKLADWIVSGSLPLDDPDGALKSLQSSVGFTMRTIAGRLVVLN
jgi:transmembrane sensor